jgi:hypothetical protein
VLVPRDDVFAIFAIYCHVTRCSLFLMAAKRSGPLQPLTKDGAELRIKRVADGEIAAWRQILFSRRCRVQFRSRNTL